MLYKMQYQTIGKTGVRISEIGFGSGNMAVLMVKADYVEQVAAVRNALDLGINYFDTAYAYGLGKSEENLGKILNDLGAEAEVSSKIRLETDALGDIKTATINAIEAALKRLQARISTQHPDKPLKVFGVYTRTESRAYTIDVICIPGDNL
jgi:aryl-alcohol dehydrogenase-like predicted oxidoreductase